MDIDNAKTPLGIGLYSFADAARLIGVEARQLRRWMSGYVHKSKGGEVAHLSPLWIPQLADTRFDGIGFRDLLELRFVKVFRDHGVSLQAIRIAAAVARDLLKSTHPFTCRQFQTDGRSIFVTIHEKTGDESLVDITRRQHVFREIVGPSLYAGIEFDTVGSALRWFPIPKSRVVVLDPERAFGQPILAKSGVPTVAISDAFTAEKGNVHFVARLFDVTPDAVRKAVKFESRRLEAA